VILAFLRQFSTLPALSVSRALIVSGPHLRDPGL
jgi:hypothetical protein